MALVGDDVVAGVDELGAQAERAQVVGHDERAQPFTERGDEVERPPAQLAQQEDAVTDPFELGEQRLELALQAALRAVAQAQEAGLAAVPPLQPVEPAADLARQTGHRPLGEGDQGVGDAGHGRNHDDRPRARETPDDRPDLPDPGGPRQGRAAELHDDHRRRPSPKNN